MPLKTCHQRRTVKNISRATFNFSVFHTVRAQKPQGLNSLCSSKWTSMLIWFAESQRTHLEDTWVAYTSPLLCIVLFITIITFYRPSGHALCVIICGSDGGICFYWCNEILCLSGVVITDTQGELVLCLFKIRNGNLNCVILFSRFLFNNNTY